MLKQKWARVFVATALTGLVGVANLGTDYVKAAPPANSNNVTICHRTHSVTNPYVRITVDQRSVGNANSKHGGGAHDYWASTVYGSKPNPNVFDPSKTYPANDKKWGDIIATTDVSGNALTGSALNVAGLNNTGIGAQIYAGTGIYAGLCRTMNARDYYEVELAAGVPSADILADMNELDSPDFASTLSACGGTFTGCNPTTLGTPSITIVTTTTVAPTTTVRGATTTTVAVTRKLKGTLWIDANRDGKKDSSEKVLSNYTVTIKAGTGNSSTQTYTVTTDSAGNYEVSNIPAGNWIVTPASLPSANYEKVYDSDSNTTSADWVVTASVPSTGTATADFATALSAAAIASGATDTLGAVAVATTTTVAAAASAGSSADSVSMPSTGVELSGQMTLVASLLLVGGLLLAVRRRNA